MNHFCKLKEREREKERESEREKEREREREQNRKKIMQGLTRLKYRRCNVIAMITLLKQISCVCVCVGGPS